MRTIVIGDVHGCIDELQELLRRCAITADDRVVLVGDLVAKGPDSQGVVQLVREAGFSSVRGNHDQKLLRVRQLPDEEARLKAHHRAIAQTMGEADWDYLEATPFFLRLPEHNCIVVHGGLMPGMPPEALDADQLMNMRSITPEGEASKKVENGVPWASRWTGPEHVVFGHDAMRGLQSHRLATGLDTGCVYGKQLTALVLPEKRLVSVAAKRAWQAVSGVE